MCVCVCVQQLSTHGTFQSKYKIQIIAIYKVIEPAEVVFK